MDRNGWVRAGDLLDNESLVNYERELRVVEDIKNIDSTALVYNLTVEDSHTYYVSEEEILVHNQCDAQIKSKRSKAVRDAWKKEVEAVKNGTSKYKWTKAQKEELLNTGKIEGYDGHHIRTVKELIGTAQEKLIESADDIVFLSEKDHLYVHAGNTQNPTDLNRLVELVPWIVERFETLGIVM